MTIEVFMLNDLFTFHTIDFQFILLCNCMLFIFPDSRPSQLYYMENKAACLKMKAFTYTSELFLVFAVQLTCWIEINKEFYVFFYQRKFSTVFLKYSYVFEQHREMFIKAFWTKALWKLIKSSSRRVREYHETNIVLFWLWHHTLLRHNSLAAPNEILIQSSLMSINASSACNLYSQISWAENSLRWTA